MTDLAPFVAAWKSSAIDTIALLRSLDTYDLPTDLPGWTIHDIAAHLAHLEVALAHGENTDFAAPVVTSDYTQTGVDARRDIDTADIIDELEAAVNFRIANEVIGAADEPAPNAPGGSGWTWETLLRNRVIDMWAHEQDIRRAVNQPGNLDSLGAQVTAMTFAAAMGFVLGKKVQAQPGQAVRWIVTGEIEMDFTIKVGDDNKAKPSNDPATTTCTMTLEEFTILGAGRKNPADLNVLIEGNQELGAKVLAAMAVTP